MAVSEKQIVTIVWEGITINVTHSPHDILAQSHIELRVPTKEKLPVTETGYRSEYLRPGSIEECGSVEAFVLGWLDEMALSREWQQQVVKDRQLSLF